MKTISDGLLIRAAFNIGQDLVKPDRFRLKMAGTDARELFHQRDPGLRWWVRNCIAAGVKLARENGGAA